MRLIVLRALAVALALFVCLPAFAQKHPAPRIAKDTSYADARKALTAQGFAGVRLPDADKCQKDDARCFPETFACAGTGLGQCVHIWRRGDTIIEVLTIGEDPVVDRVRCRANCR